MRKPLTNEDRARALASELGQALRLVCTFPALLVAPSMRQGMLHRTSEVERWLTETGGVCVPGDAAEIPVLLAAQLMEPTCPVCSAAGVLKCDACAGTGHQVIPVGTRAIL